MLSVMSYFCCRKTSYKLLLQQKNQLQVTFAAEKPVTSYFCSRKTSYKLLLQQTNRLQVTFATEKTVQVTFAADKQATSYFCSRKTSYKLLLHQKKVTSYFAPEKQRRLLVCVGNHNKSQSLTVKLHLLVSQHQTVFLLIICWLADCLVCLQIAFACRSEPARRFLLLLLLTTFV